MALVAVGLASVLTGCGLLGEDDEPALTAAPLGDASEADGGDTTSAGDGADDEGTDGADPATADGGSLTVEVPAPGETAEAVGEILQESGEDLTGTELEAYIARRYEAYWQAFDIARANPTADPGTDYPELFNLAAGEQLEVAHDDIRTLFESGQAIREPDVAAVPGLDANSAHRVRIESIDGGVAELVSCLVNDQVRYEIEGGQVVSSNVLTVQARSTMARADGTWKIIRSQATALDPGVTGCWLEDEANYPY